MRYNLESDSQTQILELFTDTGLALGHLQDGVFQCFLERGEWMELNQQSIILDGEGNAYGTLYDWEAECKGCTSFLWDNFGYRNKLIKAYNYILDQYKDSPDHSEMAERLESRLKAAKSRVGEMTLRSLLKPENS